jgi:hypothetical protein
MYTSLEVRNLELLDVMLFPEIVYSCCNPPDKHLLQMYRDVKKGTLSEI